MEEYLRRFREGVPESTELSGNAANPTILARRILAAVAARDTTVLRNLTVTRAEFAWLVFPHHMYADPPYELDPAVFWAQIESESQKGLSRLLNRYGGHRLSVVSVGCKRDTLQIKTGPARLWDRCTTRYRNDGALESKRLFGSIVERNGRAKLLSYANDF